MRRTFSASSLTARWGLFIALLMLPGLFIGCGGGGGDNDPPADTPADDSSSGDTSGGSKDNGSSDSNDNGGSSGVSRDIGDNNPNLLVAIGDSITAGSEITGPSYPQRLSSLLGRTVQNRGVPGALSSAASGQAGAALAQKPAYLLIMFGTNDVFHEVPPDTVASNIAAAVRKARAQKTIPVVATIPPDLRNTYLNGFAKSINSKIKAMARSEGAILADVDAEFGSGAGLIQEDGFHPNDTGTQIIAFAFADAIR